MVGLGVTMKLSAFVQEGGTPAPRRSRRPSPIPRQPLFGTAQGRRPVGLCGPVVVFHPAARAPALRGFQRRHRRQGPQVAWGRPGRVSRPMKRRRKARPAGVTAMENSKRKPKKLIVLGSAGPPVAGRRGSSMNATSDDPTAPRPRRGAAALAPERPETRPRRDFRPKPRPTAAEPARAPEGPRQLRPQHEGPARPTPPRRIPTIRNSILLAKVARTPSTSPRRAERNLFQFSVPLRRLRPGKRGTIASSPRCRPSRPRIPRPWGARPAASKEVGKRARPPLSFKLYGYSHQSTHRFPDGPFLPAGRPTSW